nr:putative reverse transcriptase domain-containing protein [Tanacetum cinerariifolium]
MDLLTKLPKSCSGYDAIWVIVDRLTKSAHFLPIREDYKTENLARIYINEIAVRHDVPNKERLKTARSRQKSYADKRRKPLEFKVGDRVLLKVTPWKGVVRFGKKRKLAPRYVGPFEIVECVGPVAYRLKLTQELSCIHDTFHVSNLKKCLAKPDQVPLEEIEIDENLLKVRWNSRQGPEFTWEREDQFQRNVVRGGRFSIKEVSSGYSKSSFCCRREAALLSLQNSLSGSPRGLRRQKLDAVVVRDFSKKFYNSLGGVPNRCSSIGKTRGLLSFSRGI